MAKIIGIDLGTTNSCVAIIEGGAPVVIPNAEGARTTPSIVAFTASGERLVGQVAKRQAVQNPENTVVSVKRIMGRSFGSDEARKQVQRVAYRIVPSDNNDAWVEVGQKQMSPPEVSAAVLAQMKAIAEAYLHDEVTEAVVTVPAYFDDAQRQATKDAGRIAGLEVRRIINEPTAAALAYGLDRNAEERIAVYDLGGGTFDISILEIGSEGVFRVVSTNGDTFLGGEDFDARVIDWLVDGFKAEHNIDLRKDRMALQRLKDAAEKAKIELSSVREVEINLPFIISSGRNEALHLQRVLTRAEFEKLTADLVDRTVEIVRQTLEDAGLSRDEVEDIVLVGGMTRMPRVERAVADFFGREPSKGVHPDEVVAVGAGIQGAALGEEASVAHKVVLLDVTPQTLGMMVAGGLFEPLIPKDTTVPTMRTKSFTTSRDNQTAVKILVMQGENDQADKNELLGEFILTGLRRAPAGAVEIEVTFEINADGIVSVHAKDLETGKEQSITVTATSGLTPDELRDMIDAGEQYAVERKRDEEFESRKQEAEGLIYEIEKLFDKVETVVGGSDYGRDALEKAHGVIDRTRTAIDRSDTASIKVQIDALSRTLRMFKGVVQKG